MKLRASILIFFAFQLGFTDSVLGERITNAPGENTPTPATPENPNQPPISSSTSYQNLSASAQPSITPTLVNSTAQPTKKEAGAEAAKAGTQAINNSNAFAADVLSGDYNNEGLEEILLIRQLQANQFNAAMQKATQQTAPPPAEASAPSVVSLPATPVPSFASDNSFGEVASIGRARGSSVAESSAPTAVPIEVAAPTITEVPVVLSPAVQAEQLISELDRNLAPQESEVAPSIGNDDGKSRGVVEAGKEKESAAPAEESLRDRLATVIKKSSDEATLQLVKENLQKQKAAAEEAKKKAGAESGRAAEPVPGWLPAPIAELAAAVKRKIGEFFPDHSGKADPMTQKVGKAAGEISGGSGPDGESAAMRAIASAPETSESGWFTYLCWAILAVASVGFLWECRKKFKNRPSSL